MKNKKDKNKIKFKLGNNFILWILIVLGSYYVVQLIPDTLSNSEVGYNDYRNHLENGEISQISAMEKQAGTAPGGGATMVNTNTSIDNSVRSNNMPASTAFAPASAMPAGIGQGA